MPSNPVQLEDLLEKIREEFLAELSNRCLKIEDALFRLNKHPKDIDTFQEFFREVHSIKGSGGTHGLPIISTICHQLENLITQARNEDNFDKTFLKHCFAHCDLLKQIPDIHSSRENDFILIEKKLETLKKQSLRNKKSALIVESSKVMARIFQKVIDTNTFHVDMMDDGMLALNRLLHDKFDLVILGGEIKLLNAKAIIAAIRETKSVNARTEIILISSNTDNQFPYTKTVHLIKKDQKMISNLETQTNNILNRS